MDGIYAPLRGQMKFIMRAPTCKYADSKSGFNDMVGIEIRYRQGNLAVFFIGVTEGTEVVSRSGIEMNVRSPVLSYRHRKRSRGIFYALAVLCTYEGKIKSPRCCSASHARCLTVVQGRFLALLEMTIWGKAVFSYRKSSSWGSGILPPSHGRRCPEGAEVGIAEV